MSTYVFVHGANHGGWCWDKVAPLLTQAGHTVVAPDLPGHGSDTTPITDVTLQSYVTSVQAAVMIQPEPVILVGHSMGGAVITQVAEQCPQKIERLVYLAAFLLADGESCLHWMQQDGESLVLSNVTVAPDQSYVVMNDEAAKAVFYGDCSDEDVARARSLLGPEATIPSGTPVHTTEANFGRVPRVYIETLQDKAISLGVQRRMYANLPCQKVRTMNTSHSPFLSAPEALAAHLMSL
jgi:pimeloyl-ACP methyl ester carboxylesterase